MPLLLNEIDQTLGETNETIILLNFLVEQCQEVETHFSTLE